jgi:hypothetical protein
MVVEQTDVQLQQEQADVLGDMLEKADLAAAYRDSSIPEGALLGETELQGQQVRWKKQKSMVHSGNTPLPERFEAFDRDGVPSMLPTAQMARMLSKMRADDTTARAFHTHSRGLTREACKVCPAAAEYIAQTCEFCLERTHGNVHKNFKNETDAYRHKSMFHPDELAALERATDRADREAANESQKQLAQAMMEMARATAENARHAATAEAPAPAPKAVR